MDILQGMLQGFAVCLTPAKLFACFFGSLSAQPWEYYRESDLPGDGPPDPTDVLHGSNLVRDHAGGDLLRHPVRRIDHLDPDQCPGRSGVGHHVHRRASDGQSGASRSSLGIAAFSSFIAGTLGVIGLMVVAPLWRISP